MSILACSYTDDERREQISENAVRANFLGWVTRSIPTWWIVCDGIREADERIARVLWNDPANRGVFRAQATQARLKLGLSQADFAAMLGLSVRTLKDWEQGRREPSGAAKALLKATVAAPKMVRKVLALA